LHEKAPRRGRGCGWPPVTKAQFGHLIAPKSVLVVGVPEQEAEKLLRHSEALGGVNRVTFGMDNARLTRDQLMRSIELMGAKVIRLVNSG